MPRRVRANAGKTTRTPRHPVTVKTVDPGTDWTLDQARSLIRQGYTLEHVAKRTGWPESMLKVASVK